MLNIFLKSKGANVSAANTKRIKLASVAQARIMKDIHELETPKSCKIELDDPDDLFNFRLFVAPEQGFYRRGRFEYTFEINNSYPYDPPKVKCVTKVYHPNIDLDGNVCLNILREDWRPVLNINSIIYGLQYLLLEPNPEDPLNKDAANELQTNRSMFEKNVRRTMEGRSLNGVSFKPCIQY